MRPLCVIENCGKRQVGRGWCAAHWRMWKKYGNPLARKGNPLPPVDRGNAQIIKTYEFHGQSRKGSVTYRCWQDMKSRCSRAKCTGWENYGGRGIKVCDRWQNSFSAFLSDMGEAPKNTSIDRIDNDGDYEPGNCRWATKRQQDQNRRTTRLLTLGDTTMCMKLWAKRLGVHDSTIDCRLKRGWPLERALTQGRSKYWRPRAAIAMNAANRETP